MRAEFQCWLPTGTLGMSLVLKSWNLDTLRRAAWALGLHMGQMSSNSNRKRRKVMSTRLWSMVVVTFFLGQSLLAQVTTGAISGIVRDETGGVVSGVAVSVRNVETGITRTLITDAGGRYRASNLGLGNYEVQAELSGFRTDVRSGITLTIG